MAKYTYKDIIIDPTSEEAKNCVGKEVYFADNISICLFRANNDDGNYKTTLRSVNVGDDFPFYVGSYRYQIIIPKKVKAEPEYVPFESPDEFIDAYKESKYAVINGTIGNKLLGCGGIWLKSKCDDIWIVQCTEIANHGIAIGLAQEIMLWEELFDDYEFLDGTPCGKLKGEEL